MPFCSACGADVSGKSFCAQCGAPAAGRQVAASAVQPGPPPPVVPAVATKTSPIVWILLGIAGFVVLVGFLFAAGWMFVAHKIRQNPALVTAKLLTAGNPDVEVLSADEGSNTVKFRDKKTGEIVTMDFDDVKKGKIVFKSKGQEASIEAHGDGQNGALQIKSPDGTLNFNAGSDAKIPNWVPVYPGVTPKVMFSVQGNGGDGGTFQFKTKDSAQNVLDFYEKGLKGAGFQITANIAGNIAASSGAMLTAEDAAKHSVMVTAGTEDGGATVNVIFGLKK